MATDAGANENDLIRRFKGGDEEAFRLLFDQCRNDLQARADRLMSKALKRRVSVADVLQEAMLIAFQRRGDLEDSGPDSFRNWLLGIVEMKARRAIQRHAGAAKRALGREVTRQFRADTAGYPGNDTSPSQAAMGSELEDLALRAMAALPDHYWEVLHLTRSEHMSLREAAERMGRPRETVKKLYRRALKEFTETFNRLRGETHA